MQEKESLQNQVCSQLSQISSLRTEMDSIKFGIDQQVNSEIAALRKTLQVERDTSSSREKEVNFSHDNIWFCQPYYY